MLANDTDVDGDNLSVTLDTDVSKGVLILNSNGLFNYIPAPNFNGTDSFTYIVSDGKGGTDTGIVNLTINPINDAPVAVDDAYTIEEDNTLTVDAADGVLANDSDVDGDSLSVVTVSNDVDNGTLTLNPNGSFSYTPNTNFNGNDSFTYSVSDGKGGTDTATVNVTVNPVNDAPDAVNDSAVTNEDTAVTIAVLANDVDIDGDAINSPFAYFKLR